MTVEAVVQTIGLSVLCGEDQLTREVTGVYVGDLLSDVIAHCTLGNVWVTMQTHPNIVAVSVLRKIAAVIIVGGRAPSPEALVKAQQENIPLLGSEGSAFETSGKLFSMMATGV